MEIINQTAVKSLVLRLLLLSLIVITVQVSIKIELQAKLLAPLGDKQTEESVSDRYSGAKLNDIEDINVGVYPNILVYITKYYYQGGHYPSRDVGVSLHIYNIDTNQTVVKDKYVEFWKHGMIANTQNIKVDVDISNDVKLGVGNYRVLVATYGENGSSRLSDYNVSDFMVLPAKPNIPTVTQNVSTPTNQNVTLTATKGKYGDSTQYKLPTSTTWLNYTDPLIITQNGTYNFRAIYDSGNTSEIINHTVNNIDKVKSKMGIKVSKQ